MKTLRFGEMRFLKLLEIHELALQLTEGLDVLQLLFNLDISQDRLGIVFQHYIIGLSTGNIKGSKAHAYSWLWLWL